MSSRSPHTRLQRIYRGLFRVFGPAQQGTPPYATDAELAEYRAGMATPAGSREPQTPVGYRFTHYTDERGLEHRAIVRVDPQEH